MFQSYVSSESEAGPVSCLRLPWLSGLIGLKGNLVSLFALLLLLLPNGLSGDDTLGVDLGFIGDDPGDLKPEIEFLLFLMVSPLFFKADVFLIGASE